MSENYEPILIARIPGPLPPVPEHLIRRRPESVIVQSVAEAIIETTQDELEDFRNHIVAAAVAEVEAEAETKPMSEHFKLVKVANRVAELFFGADYEEKSK